jgi:hypothetical protein
VSSIQLAGAGLVLSGIVIISLKPQAVTATAANSKPRVL